MGPRLLGVNLIMLLFLSLVTQVGVQNVGRVTAATTGAPKYSNLDVTSVWAGTPSVFATRWTDTAGLSRYVFSFDSGGGTLVNGTSTGLGGTVNWSNTTETLSSAIGAKIQWKVYAQNLNSLWNSTHTMCTITGSNGIPPGLQYLTITDDCYDLLAYDGSNLYNLGNLPQLFQTDAGGFVGYHGIQWDQAMDAGLMVGYGDALVKYTSATGRFTILATGLSSSIGLNGVAWKPNSNSFALIAGDNGVLLQYNGGIVTSLTTGTTNGLKKVAWNPNGSYALIVGDGGTLLKFTSSGGIISSIASGTGTQLSGVAFKTDGSMALIDGSGGTVLKYADALGSVSALNGVGASYQFQDASFSRDGAYALLTSQHNARGNLVMWTYSTGAFVNVTSGNTSTANQATFAPDGSYAYVTTTSGILLKQAYGATSASQVALTNDRLRGIDFYKPSGSGTTTTSTTASTSTTTTTSGTTTSLTSQSSSSTTSTSSSTSSTSTITFSSSSASTSTATTSTTTSTTSTSTSSTTSSKKTSTQNTTKSSTTSTTSTPIVPSTSISSSSTPVNGGGPGIPEFPFQVGAAIAFTIFLAASYLFARRRWQLASKSP
ncbi:MAG TPA: WD40 repeat domain-containing protein [Nitrososphaerales archaeon]|nr:WD40 repeat domain-containing protein [Nitrososphaerales archaeon]